MRAQTELYRHKNDNIKKMFEAFFQTRLNLICTGMLWEKRPLVKWRVNVKIL